MEAYEELKKFILDWGRERHIYPGYDLGLLDRAIKNAYQKGYEAGKNYNKDTGLFVDYDMP